MLRTMPEGCRSSESNLHHYSHSVVGGLALALALLSPGASRALPPSQPPKLPAVRWDEATPGCTFSRSEDGKYRYGLWTNDIGITLAVDSQELEKVHRRHEPFFSLWLSVRYRSKESLEVSPENISLEFTSHFQIIQKALDPDGFAAKVQNDADEVDHQTAREIERHPEQKASKEAYVRAFQKDSAELLEFVSKNSLGAAHLDAANPEVSGWVFFSTNSKWIGKWKKREEFVLRLPLGGKIFEFPFRLPPKEGELILRKRE
jgi:hypothetical protein